MKSVRPATQVPAHFFFFFNRMRAQLRLRGGNMAVGEGPPLQMWWGLHWAFVHSLHVSRNDGESFSPTARAMWLIEAFWGFLSTLSKSIKKNSRFMIRSFLSSSDTELQCFYCNILVKIRDS